MGSLRITTNDSLRNDLIVHRSNVFISVCYIPTILEMFYRKVKDL